MLPSPRRGLQRIAAGADQRETTRGCDDRPGDGGGGGGTGDLTQLARDGLPLRVILYEHGPPTGDMAPLGDYTETWSH